MIVFVGLRCTGYVAYYRKRPTQGNIVSLILVSTIHVLKIKSRTISQNFAIVTLQLIPFSALSARVTYLFEQEVANIAYSFLTGVARAAILILISIIFVGRLDTPLLAPGVGLGPIGMYNR